MARSPWHPYAPDQAFGHQAAVDQALLDDAIARLEDHRQHPPRAGSKAEPNAEGAMQPAPPGAGFAAWIGSGAGLPVTTNVALDAAASLRSEVD